MDHIEAERATMTQPLSNFAQRPRRLATVLVLFASLLLAPFAAIADDLLVFAAASLKPSLDKIVASPDVTALGSVKVSYAA
ncbi:MAG: hypothetical protein ABIW82_11865, partial [Dokdonella sp.]